MVEYPGTKTRRQIERSKRKRLYRKWYLDHYRGARHDTPDRSPTQCISWRFQPNHQQSQCHSLTHIPAPHIAGNSFIELLLVLPIFLTVMMGSISIFLWVQESYAAGQAAQVGVSTWASTGNLLLARNAIDQALQAEGYSSHVAWTAYTQRGSLDVVTVSLPFRSTFWPTTPIISSTRSAVQETGIPSGSQSWW